MNMTELKAPRSGVGGGGGRIIDTLVSMRMLEVKFTGVPKRRYIRVSTERLERLVEVAAWPSRLC
jgi:hypothetical protein